MTLPHRTSPLLVLALLWIVFFPVKGVVFQLCLYLLPLLVLLITDTRLLLREQRHHLVVLSLCFAVPLFLSELRALLLWGCALSDGAFEAFWRLAFFPLVVLCVCRFYRCSSRHILIAFTAVGIFYGLAGLSGVFFGDVLMTQSFGARAAGFVSNPNPFGFLMAVTFVVALYLLMSSQRIAGYILGGGGVVVGFSGLLVSGSRSALLGGVVALVAMVVLGWCNRLPMLSHKTLWTGVGISVLLGGIFVALPSHFLDLLNHRLVHVAQGDIRLTIWSHYLERFFEHPIMGVPISCSQKIQLHSRSYGPHNMYLSTLVQSGLVGLVALLSGLFWLVRRALMIDHQKIVVVPMALLLCCYCFFNSSFFGNEMTQGVFALIVVLSLQPLNEVNG